MPKINAGKQVAEHADLFEPVILRCMEAHTAEAGCGWKQGTVEAALCALSDVLEKHEICKAEEAA